MKALYQTTHQDKILFMLSLGKIKFQTNNEKEEGIVKRMTDCCLNSQAQYGPREYLEEIMKKHNIHYEKDPKSAKYKILSAPLIIDPKIIITRSGKWINFLNLSQKKYFRSNQQLSECAVRLHQKSKQTLIKNLQQILKCQLTIQQSDSFPSHQPIFINQNEPNQELNHYHSIINSDNILYFIDLNRTQDQLLACYYRDKDPKVYVIRTNREIYSKNVRGTQLIDMDSSFSSNNNETVERIDQILPQANQLQQSEVIIIDNQPQSSVKKFKIRQDIPQQQYLVDQLNDQEIKQIISEKVEISMDSYEKKIMNETQGTIERFTKYWRVIKNRYKFNVEIDELDPGRGYNEPFFMIGKKNLLLQ